MVVQKAGQQSLRAIHLLLATTITVAIIVHHMEHIHQAMITLATMIIQHITASRLLTGVAMLQLLPAMHLLILVRYSVQHFSGLLKVKM